LNAGKGKGGGRNFWGQQSHEGGLIISMNRIGATELRPKCKTPKKNLRRGEERSFLLVGQWEKKRFDDLTDGRNKSNRDKECLIKKKGKD